MQETFARNYGSAAIGEVLRCSWRERGLLLAIALLTFAAAAFVIVNLKPFYRAETLLLLPTATAGSLNDRRSYGGLDTVELRTEVELLRSDALARSVIERMKLSRMPEFDTKPSTLKSALKDITTRISNALRLSKQQPEASTWSPEELRLDRLVSEYKRRLSVFNDGRSATAYVSFDAEDPHLAAAITNAHAAAYLEEQAQRRLTSQRAASQWLSQELEARAEDLRKAQEAVQSFRSEHGLVLTTFENQTQSTVDREMTSLTERLAAANADLATAQARIGQVPHAPSDGETLQGTTDMINSPVLVKLREREADAKLALARLENSFAPESPGFNAAKSEVATVQALISAEVTRIRDALEADKEAAARRADLLRTALKDAERRKLGLDAAQGELVGRESVANSKRSIYDAVLNRYNVLLTEQQYQTADAKIIAAAFVPTQHVFPKTTLFLLIAALGAVGLGTIAAVLRDRTTRAKTPVTKAQKRPAAELSPAGQEPAEENV